MFRSFRTIWSVALALALLNACSKPPPPPPPDIAVTPEPKQIPADGTTTSTVTVARPDGQPVNLHTSKGTFTETNTNSIDFTSGSGTATLIACDSRVKSSCAGTASLAASSDDGASGSGTVTFLQIEICNNKFDDNKDGKKDCEDTATCQGKSCQLESQDGGVDRGTCDPSGTCVCSMGQLEICDDGKDNNCDGLIDCADPLCDNQTPPKACKQGNGFGGVCQGGKCVCGATELCDNNNDDNCDGKTDCQDPTCQAVGNTAGKVCNSVGMTCSSVGNDGGMCSVCPGGQVNESTCGDTKDNDCDGLFDCDDSDCSGQACGTGNGFICHPDGGTVTGTGCGCSGNGGVAQVTETTCNDGFDNDCDGKADCDDPDCVGTGGANGKICGANGLKCMSLHNCTCGSLVENCATPGDDNCDGLINCQDPACQPGTGPGKVCDAFGNICSAAIGGNPSTCSVCTVTPTEASEGVTGGASFTCGDLKDNDCNGKTDCADPACTGKLYNSFGAVCFANGTSGCPSGLTNEGGLCNDTTDNDCDGKVDCVDPDCQPGITNPDGGVCGTGKGFGCSTAGTCVCKGNGGQPQTPNETSCNDGADNDCDGLADCADPDCRPVGNNLGKVCDAVGNTCSIPDGGTSSCSVCSGNGGAAQTSEYSCGDNHDNDCDGLIDCQDPSCNNLSCSATGKLCASNTCTCPGTEGSGEVSCADGKDNDCDGQFDCVDSDCRPGSSSAGKTCNATGGICNAGGACACSGNGGTAETTEGSTATSPATCGDGVDNDCDGLVDCADDNCRPTVVGSFGKDCSSGTRIGVKCDITGQCVCPGGQATEASCGDGLDNDCDGKIDCADPDCLSKACTSSGKTCSVTSSSGCTCPSGISNETNCLDGLDNDCDGQADCVDLDCQGSPGKQCAASANYLCTNVTGSWICKDQTSNYTVTLVTNHTRIPADGINTATITATLKFNGTVQSGKTITFSVSGGGSVNPTTVTTDASGNAVTTFTSGTASGLVTITGSYDTGSGIVSGTVTVDQPRLGQIKFTSQQYSVMGVKFSSFQETNQITFQALDSNNQPYPPGLTIAFSHTPVGGSYIGSVASCTSTTCTASGTTDVSGFVSVILHSGTVAGVVSVSADASAGGGVGNATASNIAIVGAKANGLHLTLDCTPKNVPAFTNTTCSNSQYSATINCRASFADRFNNVLGVATTATFSTEAGAAGPPAQTPIYTPGNPALGQAFGFVAVAGYSLPVDVAPFSGEYGLNYTDGCRTTIHNPRDGLVTITVQAIGEEGFVDGSNGKPANGQYDVGENFVDQGEPFVDANDNGLQDANEAYTDVNSNGSYNVPNGVWDSDTVIWAETRIVYTGYTSVMVTSGPTQNIARFYQLNPADPNISPATPAAVPSPSPTVRFSLPVNGPSPAIAGVVFSDFNFNVPTAATTYGLSVISGTETANFTTAPTNTDRLGLNFTQQFCTTTTGGTCGSACTSAPCFIVTNVGGYGYGNYGRVSVGAGAGTTTNGEVRATAVLSGVSVPVSIFGDVQ